MTQSARVPKILLIDSNVYFSKRLSDALKKEGFQVLASTQPEFALTTLEYDTPTAVVCATNMRGMGALEIANIIHADPKNAALPIIALGDGSQRALMEAFQAGCDDYIDRQRQPAVIAAHIRNIIISKAEGFQPTQMLAQADTSLSGSLTHHDLPGVLQMLGHAHQTGALHINAGATDAVLFFDAGNITHAECGSLFGDEAVIHIVKSCIQGGEGVYKFVYGATTPRHTVLRSATDLMLDAMREYDESANSVTDATSAAGAATLDSILGVSPEDRQLGAASSDFQEGAGFPQRGQDPSDTSAVFSQPDQNPSDSTAPSQQIESSPEIRESASTPEFNAFEQTTTDASIFESLFTRQDSSDPVAASSEPNAAEFLEPQHDSPEPSSTPIETIATESESSTPASNEIASDDSVTGYTETTPQPDHDRESTGTELVLAAEAAEEISLLEKILMELAARHIVDESPADLADKEAQ
jgi:CheY-like chemotaxis protein